VKASPVLFGDEFHLFEHTVAYSLPRGSCTLIDREPESIPNGPDRLHRLHLHLNGESGEEFQPWLTEWAQRLASAPEVQKLRLHRLGCGRQRHPQFRRLRREQSGNPLIRANLDRGTERPWHPLKRFEPRTGRNATGCGPAA
jgi:hypothetical protein